jgi:adenylosuccinate lyase
VLVAAVKRGVGREAAHEAIREHAVSVALAMREKGAERNDLLDRLAGDERLGLSGADLAALVSAPIDFTGAASAQVAEVVRRVEAVVSTHTRAAAYSPGPIL